MNEKKDVLAALARSRPPALEPSRLAGSPRQQADLRAIVTGPEPATVRVPPRVRRTWRIGLPAAGVAVAAVAAILVTTVGSGPEPTPATNTGPVVLMDMATAIQRQDTTPGTYWQTVSERGSLIVVGTKANPYVVRQSYGIRYSSARLKGGQDVSVVFLNTTAQPWTARDRAKWQAAGSPSRVTFPDHPDAPGVRIGPGQPAITSVGRSDGILATVGPVAADYHYLSTLPTDPAGLKAVFDKAKAAEHDDTGDEPGTLLDDATDLITSPAPPAVRAAAYRLIAGLPGLASLGHVTDPLGRPGVAFMDRGTPLVDGLKEVIVVDPRTASLLAIETVLVQPDAQETAAGLTPGTDRDYVAYDRLGWSDRQISTK